MPSRPSWLQPQHCLPTEPCPKAGVTAIRGRLPPRLAPHAPDAASQEHGQQAGEQAQSDDARLVALSEGPGRAQLLCRVLWQQAQQLPPALSPRGSAIVRGGGAIATRWQSWGQGDPRGEGVTRAVQRGGQQEGTQQEGEGAKHDDLDRGLHRRRADALREGETGQ